MNRMEVDMLARDIMTKTVRTISPDALVRDAARLLALRRISAVPVVDRRRRVIGILSEGDLVRRRETGTERRKSWWLGFLADPRSDARDYAKSRGAKVRDVMTRTVLSVAPDTQAADIADLLEKRGIKRVPVIEDGALVGIVSRGDLVQALARESAPSIQKTPDSTISVSLQREIDSARWVNKCFVSFSVNKGVVEFWGLVADPERKTALTALAGGVKGVRTVKNHLSIMPRLSFAA